MAPETSDRWGHQFDSMSAARSLAFALVILMAPVVAAQGPAGRPPVLTLGVRCGAELRAPAAGPLRVSNLGLIGLEIGMHYFEVPPVQTSPGPLDLILAKDEGRPSTEQPNVEIEIVKLGAGARVPSPARFHSSGVSGGSEYRDKQPGARFAHAISVWLDVPLDEIAQRTSFEQFLDELRKAGKLDVARRYELFRGNRALLEYLVREHQPGEYEVRARYRPRPSDYWQGELRSVPLRLDIVPKGRWFDPLLTGRAPTGGGCE